MATPILTCPQKGLSLSFFHFFDCSIIWPKIGDLNYESFRSRIKPFDGIGEQ